MVLEGESLASAAKTVSQVVDILEALDELVTAQGRSDLTERLVGARKRLESPYVPVVMVGGFKAGKSSLVNALVQSIVCPVDPDVATCVPTVVRYGEEVKAVVYSQPEVAGEAAQSTEILLTELQDYVTENGASLAPGSINSAEVLLPADILRTGLVLIDSPGTGAITAAAAAALLQGLPGTEGLLFVSDADREFSDAELDLLQNLSGMAPTTICAITKCDLQVHWRAIVDLNAGHLRRLGIDCSLVSTAAPLWDIAGTVDPSLHVESGIPELTRLLQEAIVPRALKRFVSRAAWEASEVLGAYRAMLLATSNGLDPSKQSGSLERLREELDSAQTLSAADADWRCTVDDGAFDDDEEAEIKGIDQLLEEVPYIVKAAIKSAANAIEHYIDATSIKELEQNAGTAIEAILVENVEGGQAELRRDTEALTRRVVAEFEVEAEQATKGMPTFETTRRTRPNVAEHNTQHQLFGLSMDHAEAYREAISSVLGTTSMSIPGIAFSMIMGAHEIRQSRKDQYRSEAEKYLDERLREIEQMWRQQLRRHRKRLIDLFGNKADDIERAAKAAVRAAEKAAATVDLKDVSEQMARISLEMIQLDAIEREIGAILADG